jgi:hypothetical protein
VSGNNSINFSPGYPLLPPLAASASIPQPLNKEFMISDAQPLLLLQINVELRNQ